jgi:hypothetical protein
MILYDMIKSFLESCKPMTHEDAVKYFLESCKHMTQEDAVKYFLESYKHRNYSKLAGRVCPVRSYDYITHLSNLGVIKRVWTGGRESANYFTEMADQFLKMYEL